MIDLFHYTCDHGQRGLRELGFTKPNLHPAIGVSLTWFTTADTPDEAQLGLTHDTLECDRTSFRYLVVDAEPEDKIEPWLGSMTQARTSPFVQAELHRHGKLETWWIATVPVLIVREE